MIGLAPSPWPDLFRPSRLGAQCRARLSEMPGMKPGMTWSGGAHSHPLVPAQAGIQRITVLVSGSPPARDERFPLPARDATLRFLLVAMTDLAPSSWPDLFRPSRLGAQCRARLSEMPGMKPSMTWRGEATGGRTVNDFRPMKSRVGKWFNLPNRRRHLVLAVSRLGNVLFLACRLASLDKALWQALI